jgi:hypothetical protein
MRTTIATLTAAALITTPGALLTLDTAAARAAPTQVNVRIEGRTETLFEGPILTEGHDIQASSDTQKRPCDGTNNDAHTSPGPTPTTASVDAMDLIGETFDGEWYPGYDDYFITRWGPDEESVAEAAYWGILVNNVFTNVGGCQYELQANGEVLWVYNAFEHEPFLSLLPVEDNYTSGLRPLTATAHLGQSFEVEVLDYADDEEDNPPSSPERKGAVPLEGADVSPVETSAKGFEKIETSSAQTVTTDAQGKARITFTETGWHRIKAAVVMEGKEDPARSNRLDICVPAPHESGCGQPPAEDQPRTSRYIEQAREREEAEAKKGAEHHEESTGPGAGEQSTANAGVGQVGGGSGTTTGPGPLASVAVVSLSRARLLLNLTAPGEATVKIARLRGKGHHSHLQTVKRIAVKASKAGVLKVKLPRLAAGSYQVSVSLTGAKTVVKTLTVPRA